MESYRHYNGLGKDNPVAAMDPILLGLASAAAMIALVGSIITCLCCDRPSESSRSNSYSGGDTVPLEDLLSKPTLADPESVFSEFRFDSMLSNEETGITFTPDDGLTSSLTSSSPTSQESVGECQKPTPDKRANRKSRRDYRKCPSELNNIQGSLYNKNNSGKSQTFQNDLTHVSNKTDMLQSKIDNDKRVNDVIKQEIDNRKEKNSNVQDELKKNNNIQDDLDTIDIPEALQPKSSLEVLNINRNSSGSESVSFSSSARGSVCHDIGTSANEFRLPRTSLYPRPDGWNRKDSRKEDDQEAHGLPGLEENPIHKTMMQYTNEPDAQDTVIVVNEVCGKTETASPSTSVFSEADSKKGQENCGDQTKIAHSCERRHEREDNRKCKFQFDAKRLQTSCSFDGYFHDQQRSGVLPERISLNLQIDFHFPPTQGQSQGKRPVPIVVCSPMSGCDDFLVPSVSKRQEGHNDVPSSKPIHPISNAATVPETIDPPKPDPETFTGNISIISKKMSSNVSDENVQELRKNSGVSLTPDMPSWVKSRLSEPLDVCKWREKMSHSPNLKRRSFTIADFQSLKFQPFSEIYATCLTSKFISSENKDDLKIHNTKITMRPKVVKEDTTSTSNPTHEKHCEKEEIRQNDVPLSQSTQQISSDEIIEHIENTSDTPLPSAEEKDSCDNNPSNEIAETEISPDDKHVQNMEMAVAKDSAENKNNLIPGGTATEAIEYDLNKTMSDNTVGEKIHDTEEGGEKKPKEDVPCQHEGIAGESFLENVTTGALMEGFIADALSQDSNDESKSEGSPTDTLEETLTSTNSGQDPTSGVACKEFVSEKENLNQEDTPKSVNDNSMQESLSGQSDTDALNEATLSEFSFPGKTLNKQSSADGLYKEMEPKPAGDHLTSKELRSKSTNINLNEQSASKSMEKESVAKTTSREEGSNTHTNDTDHNKVKISLRENEDCRRPSELPKSISCGYLPNHTTSLSTATDDGIQPPSNNTYPGKTHSKAISADNSMDTNTLSADNSLDANIASDDSDYDNPWDSLDNAVKRASMKYHKRPSVAASRARELMLKSAEDLGRLIELAETRRRERQASTKSMSDEFDCDTFPGFKRTPLRHTVKGVLSHKSADRLDVFGARPIRNAACTQSLRKSKDDSDQCLDSGKSITKLPKSRKWYSPENRRKRDL